MAIYVHVPWCVRKCPYCDFNSHVAPAEGAPFDDYATALLADLELELGRRPPAVTPGTLFFGGGTPSLLPPEVLARLVEHIRALSGLARDAEITLEANPGTIERGRFADYAAAGVNRVSLGAQSFDDGLLRRIGRIHSAAETLRAVDELAAAGVENYNLDLMYGLPGQDERGALADLEQAIACGPAHVSWYELTLEPGTAFYRRPPRLPGEDALVGMEAAGRARLAAAGYQRYEVSAYARGTAQCRHNLGYWTYGDYIGIGPGAHGKRTHQNSIWRTERVHTTAVGYAGGFTPNPTYEETCSGSTGHTEAVLVVWDPAKVSLDRILQTFWEGHDPTQGMRQGNDIGTQYRSAVYPTTDAQLAAAEDSRARYQQALKEAGFGEISTEIRPAAEAGPFYYAEDYHQGYLAKNPWGYCNHGFCQVAYDPAAHGQDAPTRVGLPEA